MFVRFQEFIVEYCTDSGMQAFSTAVSDDGWPAAGLDSRLSLDEILDMIGQLETV